MRVTLYSFQQRFAAFLDAGPPAIRHPTRWPNRRPTPARNWRTVGVRLHHATQIRCQGVAARRSSAPSSSAAPAARSATNAPAPIPPATPAIRSRHTTCRRRAAAAAAGSHSVPDEYTSTRAQPSTKGANKIIDAAPSPRKLADETAAVGVTPVARSCRKRAGLALARKTRHRRAISGRAVPAPGI